MAHRVIQVRLQKGPASTLPNEVVRFCFSSASSSSFSSARPPPLPDKCCPSVSSVLPVVPIYLAGSAPVCQVSLQSTYPRQVLFSLSNVPPFAPLTLDPADLSPVLRESLQSHPTPDRFGFASQVSLQSSPIPERFSPSALSVPPVELYTRQILLQCPECPCSRPQYPPGLAPVSLSCFPHHRYHCYHYCYCWYWYSYYYCYGCCENY